MSTLSAVFSSPTIGWPEVLLRLFVAAALGGAIGLERELRERQAGLRTHLVVSVGAALFTLVSAYGFTDFGARVDPTRIAAQIVTGIGFLGAGAILHERGSVVGLTTAATIWVVAAIGMGVGAGAYAEAVGTTVMVCLVLIGLRPIERKLVMVRRTVTATLRVAPNTDFATFEDAFRDSGVHVRSRRTYDHVGDRTFELTLVGPSKRFDVLVDVLRRRQDVVSVYVD